MKTIKNIDLLLSFIVKPEIVRTPQNLSVLSGEDAYFECIATGDPMPLIVWKKGNTQVAEGRSLRLESITPSEQGRYICLVENIVGSDMASAVLTVYGRCVFSYLLKLCSTFFFFFWLFIIFNLWSR